ITSRDIEQYCSCKKKRVKNNVVIKSGADFFKVQQIDRLTLSASLRRETLSSPPSPPLMRRMGGGGNDARRRTAILLTCSITNQRSKSASYNANIKQYLGTTSPPGQINRQQFPNPLLIP